MVMGKRIRVIALLLCALGCYSLGHADAQNAVDALLDESLALIRSTPEKASAPLTKLQALRDTFTPAQNQRYHALYAKYLGWQGRHEERIALVQSIIGQVQNRQPGPPCFTTWWMATAPWATTRVRCRR